MMVTLLVAYSVTWAGESSQLFRMFIDRDPAEPVTEHTVKGWEASIDETLSYVHPKRTAVVNVLSYQILGSIS